MYVVVTLLFVSFFFVSLLLLILLLLRLLHILFTILPLVLQPSIRLFFPPASNLSPFRMYFYFPCPLLF